MSKRGSRPLPEVPKTTVLASGAYESINTQAMTASDKSSLNELPVLDECAVMVKNVPDAYMSEEMLEMFFESKPFNQVPSVKKVVLLGNNEATVTFDNPEDARFVLKTHRENPCELKGHRLTILPMAPVATPVPENQYSDEYVKQTDDSRPSYEQRNDQQDNPSGEYCQLTDVRRSSGDEKERSYKDNHADDFDTVEVTGFTDEVSDDCLRYYFENTNKSRGGEIEAFSRSEGHAFITFKDKTSARNVSQAEHTLGKCKLNAVPVLINHKAVMFTHLPEELSEEEFALFLEAKLHLHEAPTIVICRRKLTAVVDFNSPIEISKAVDVCAKYKLKGKHIEAHQVPVSRSIVVYELPEGCTHDIVLFYFENTKRSAGGPVQSVESEHLEDGYCIVHFVDHKVVESVCNKTDHTLNSVPIKVAPYRLELGLPDECEAAVGPHKRSFTLDEESYDQYKLKYFRKQPAMQVILNEELRMFSASVNYSDDNVTVECTVAKYDPAFRKLKNWEETTRKIVHDAFERVVVKKRSVDSEMWAPVKEGLQKVIISDPDRVALFMENNNGFIILVAEESIIDSTWIAVLENIEATETTYKAGKEAVSQIISIKRFKGEYLKKSGFDKHTHAVRMEYCEKAPYMEITLTGKKKDVDECTRNIYMEIEDIESKKISLEPEHARLLKRMDIQKAITKEMNTKNLTDIWEIYEDSVIMYTKERDDLQMMEHIIVHAVSKVVVTLDKHSLEAISSEKWKTLENGLRSMCKYCLEIRIDDKLMQLCIFTTPTMEDKVQDAVEEFRSKNVVYIESFSVDASRAKFMKEHMDTEVSQIRKSVEKIDILSNGCIEIEGTSASIKPVRKALVALADKLLAEAHEIEKPNIKQYFCCNKGMECIQKAESHGPCVIESKESGFSTSIRIGISEGRKMTFKKPTPCAEVTVNGTKISVVAGDITELKVDVLVNAANRTLKHRGGLARVIQEKGGDAVTTDSEKRIQQEGDVKEGEVYMGVSGNLGFKAVAHAVGPQWKGGKDSEDKLLRNAILNCLKESEKGGYKSIAFPALSAGMFNYPIDQCCKEIIAAIDGYLKDHKFNEVILCDISENTVKTFCDALLAQYPSTHILLKVGETGLGGQIDIHNMQSRPSSRRSRRRTEHSSSNEVSFGKVKVEVVKSALEQEQVDIIVNSASADLKLNKGMLSRALSDAAGQGLQSELDSMYPHGIQAGREVASTANFHLPCKHIYHVAVKQYSSTDDLKSIEHVVSECLKLADKDGHSSIAFPAIGTGAQKFPISDVAKTMLSSVDWFSRHYNKSSVVLVRIVIYYKDDAVYQAFVDALNGAQGASGGPSDASTGSSNASNHVQIGSLNLIVVPGDITSERVDAIVASCSKDLDLDKGQVTKIIRTKAGNALLQDGNFRKETMEKEGLVMTVGGNLHAKHVIFVKPQSNPSAWQPFILAALRKAADENLKSISFPALGTNYGCKPFDIGLTLRSAIEDFSQQTVKNLTDVRVVVFQADMIADIVMGLNKAGASHSKRRRSKSPVQESRSTRPHNKDEDNVQFTIYSSSKDGIKRAIESIDQTIKDEWVMAPISDCKPILNNKQIKELEMHAANNHVALTVDQREAKICIIGLIVNVSNMKDQVHIMLRNADKYKHEQEIAELLQSVVQWVFLKETKTVEFDKTTNQIIEQAFMQNQKSVPFKVGLSYYTIDFDKMKEWDVKSPGTKYPVLRRDLRNETKLDIPSHWSAMNDPVQVECVTLSKSDKEFVQVEQEFSKSMGQEGHITKIERIQNATLYTQYLAKKKQMQTSCKRENVEHTLWHGTAHAAVKSINAHGFNRSYCGKNATLFGQGVYFAVRAAYSAQPKYSPPDSAGHKQMYRCLVLTGDCTRGAKDMRAPPAKNQAVPHILYDSVSDNPGRPEMCVIFNDTQAYPAHLITFK
ncbi:protein mono-ADP-ribosyltransferase PARP14-like isoform X2 [Dreissena polymorpha]|uniref:protein mono-ADP-ribosyltransferase PARP14-like isoform X2 n=1 Tax=Dreissena polymorpha TaxID=45954 RepID=UPI0022647222|nr:protein mono-ADP-ribosyltransferase PARP14-like isoform X2 [Dreissena polymorpha]